MSKAKYHHRIPQTYMKAWCFLGDSVWMYDKDTKKSEPRNISSIMGINYFHSIKAGSVFTTQDALDNIFCPLESYIVYNVDDKGLKEELKNKEDFNNYFNNFEKWIILDKLGKEITKKQRIILFEQLSQASDNSIEEAWSKKYENDWASVISEIYKTIIDINSKKSIMLTDNAKKVLMDYFVMFQWRSSKGNEEARAVFDRIMDIIPDISYLKIDGAIHKEDKTVADEIWHDFLLRSYSKFLNDSGVMKTERNSYYENLTFIFLVDAKERFISSDNPCFTFTNRDGFKEPILVALPGLIITLAKKDMDAPNSYKIIEMEDEEVDYYNRIIFENGNKIISRDKLSDSLVGN